MPWTIQYTKQAEKQLSKLSPEIEERIRAFMRDRVAPHFRPIVRAKRLTGAYEDEIRYRVGDYRVVCRVQGRLLIILVVEVAHRREVYR